ncbi:hypothetical protein BU15DRAFT_82859 [Melanogaster broomeanus]|nr:hypothetical protein BU15DRAFT_82859 [Melanogaster broomeanus]
MSSASKSITPAPVMPGIDWARLKTPELDSDIEDNDKVAAAKAKERRRRKVEKKRREDEEKRAREEEEKRRREEEERRRREEEAELRKREEEQRKREEEQRKREEAAEASKKRQRDEGGAGPSAIPVSEPWCIRCAGAGVTCEFINDGNKRRTACKRCAGMREKCEWPEMDMSGPGKDKGKGKQVPTSPRQGEKKKWVRKAKVQDDEVEIVGERMAGAGPSRISLDRLIVAIEELSGRMGELAQAQRESTQAHWDSTQAHWESTQAHRESTLASRKARKALEMFVDEAAICGAPEESPEESEEEEVDGEEIDEELAGLREDVAENPMSPPKV